MKKYSIFIVVALTFIACAYAYFQFLKPLDVFLWDESHHGFYGMQIYNDLRAFNPGAFWTHTNSQALWMPLHSWFDGVFLLIFGFSYTSARLSSLFLFFACSILVYLIGVELSGDKGWIIGIIASILFLTSPMMLHFATVNMQEMLGTFVSLLIVFFIVRYLYTEEVWKYLVIGILLSVMYWTKLNYAIQAVLGVGLFHISLFPGFDKSKLEAIKKWFTSGLLIVAGILPLFILWWVTPPFQRKYGLGVTFWTQGGTVFFPDIGFIGRVIFYLQSLVSSYNFSFWTGLGCLAALVASFRVYFDKKIRLLSLMFIANLLLVSYSLNIQERYLGVTVPLVFLMLAALSVHAFERLQTYRTAMIVACALLVCVACAIGYDALSLTRYTKEVANRSILFFIYKDSLNKFSPPFLFGLVKRPAFTYPMNQPKKYSDFKVVPKSSVRDILNFFSSNIESDRSISTMISFAQISPYVIYWHFHDWKANVLTVNDLGFNPQYFWISDYFLDIQPSEDSPYYLDWLDKRWNEVSKVLLRDGLIRLTAKKEFADLGLTANIYKRERLFYLK